MNKALELARGEKLIGKPLDARVTLYVPDAGAIPADEAELEKLCIVSQIRVVAGPGDGVKGENVDFLTVHVEPSSFPKCLRCWTRSESVGSDADHPELCARCAAVVKAITL